MSAPDATVIPAEERRGFDPRAWVPTGTWFKIAAPICAPLLILLLIPLLGIDVPSVVTRSVPFMLAALAVALPARAGLINVGGEGQIFLGAVFGAAMCKIVGDGLPLVAMLPLVLVFGALGGALWVGIAAFLKAYFNVNETIATLLLNYVALYVLSYMVNGALKDPDSYGFAIGAMIPDSATLPGLGFSDLSIGIVLAVLVTVAVWLLLDRSRWGFRAKVVGGNPEAARRGGFAVNRTVVMALLMGGAIAGFAGVIELCGTELQLRSQMAAGFGYIGFLCSWMVAHRSPWIPAGATLLAAISVYGDTLQTDFSLPAASVYVVMAVIVLLVLGLRGSSAKGGKA
ncbi:MAG: ABC transporter permease [Solirubrobacterales bacterium]